MCTPDTAKCDVPCSQSMRLSHTRSMHHHADRACRSSPTHVHLDVPCHRMRDSGTRSRANSNDKGIDATGQHVCRRSTAAGERSSTTGGHGPRLAAEPLHSNYIRASVVSPGGSALRAGGRWRAVARLHDPQSRSLASRRNATWPSLFARCSAAHRRTAGCGSSL